MTWSRLVLVSRNIGVYLSLFHIVWSVFAVVFRTLILFLSFSTDHDLVWSNVELHWSFTVFAVVFQALVYVIIDLLSWSSKLLGLRWLCSHGNFEDRRLILFVWLRPREGGTPFYGLYGDVPLDRAMAFVLSVLNRPYNFARVCPNQGIKFRASLS